MCKIIPLNNTPAEAIMAPWLVKTTQFPDFDQFPMVPTGRVTLVGDSAYAMSNVRGLGGNNVLEDDWPQLTKKYEREMFARAKIAIQESENAAEYFRSLRSR